jgi:hypothetical protein
MDDEEAWNLFVNTFISEYTSFALSNVVFVILLYGAYVMRL